MKPLVKKEWRKLLYHLRKYGAEETSKRVCKLIKTNNYPDFLSFRFIESLMKQGEYIAAGRVIRAVAKTGVQNPLFEELRSSWMWCTGKRKAALTHAVRSARRWERPYLFSHAAALYSLSGRSEKAEEFFRLARESS